MAKKYQKYEEPDPTPVAVPVGFGHPETLEQKIKRFVRNERYQAALAAAGAETFEESLDFNVDDDIDPHAHSTPWQERADVETEIEDSFRAANSHAEMKKLEARLKELQKIHGPSEPSSGGKQNGRPKSKSTAPAKTKSGKAGSDASDDAD
ncbi:hypothetical protein [Tortoise microvirus 92]|nr:hypothetical protein [Tortoise microvirus 92]